MKKLLLLSIILLSFSCSKEDECKCEIAKSNQGDRYLVQLCDVGYEVDRSVSPPIVKNKASEQLMVNEHKNCK